MAEEMDYKKLADLCEKTIRSYEVLNDDLKVTEAYAEVMALADRANKYIEENAPWAMAKDPSQQANLESVMAHLAHVLFVVMSLLSPILVKKAPRALDFLGLSQEERDYKNLHDVHFLDGKVTCKGEPLFPRLNVDEEVKAIGEMMAAPKEAAAA